MNGKIKKEKKINDINEQGNKLFCCFETFVVVFRLRIIVDLV